MKLLERYKEEREEGYKEGLERGRQEMLFDLFQEASLSIESAAFLILRIPSTPDSHEKTRFGKPFFKLFQLLLGRSLQVIQKVGLTESVIL